MLLDVELIIYDLDGVLIDSTEAIVEAFEHTLKEIGVEYEEDKLMPLMGTASYTYWRRCCRRSTAARSGSSGKGTYTTSRSRTPC
jgi:beta-phosphoglucomutase-like phosphatase (HAD superfamily)